MAHAFVVDRHFWPDTNPYALMLRDIVDWMSEAETAVTVITAQPGYRPKLSNERHPRVETLSSGVKVYRIPLLPEKLGRLTRNLNYCLFTILAALLFFALALKNIRSKTACFTSTIPPIIQPLLLLVAAKMTRTRFVYNVHDIYPDVRRKPGAALSKMHRLAEYLDCITLRHADRVFVLSEDMKRTLDARQCRKEPILVLNNFPLTKVAQDDVDSAMENRKRRNDTFEFVFAGNLGRYQNLQELVSFFAFNPPPNATLTIIGDGVMEQELRELAAKSVSNSIRFKGWIKTEDLPAALATADFGVATLAPDIIKYAFPSKILTYWDLGLPILTTVSDDTALAHRLERENLGVATQPGAVEEGVMKLIEEKKKHLEGVAKYRKSHPKSYWRNRWIDITRDVFDT